MKHAGVVVDTFKYLDKKNKQTKHVNLFYSDERITLQWYCFHVLISLLLFSFLIHWKEKCAQLGKDSLSCSRTPQQPGCVLALTEPRLAQGHGYSLITAPTLAPRFIVRCKLYILTLNSLSKLQKRDRYKIVMLWLGGVTIWCVPLSENRGHHYFDKTSRQIPAACLRRVNHSPRTDSL